MFKNIFFFSVLPGWEEEEESGKHVNGYKVSEYRIYNLETQNSSWALDSILTPGFLLIAILVSLAFNKGSVM